MGQAKRPNAPVVEHREGLKPREDPAVRGQIHPGLQRTDARREAIRSHDLAFKRECGVSILGVVTHLEALVMEEERTGIRELPGPFAVPARPPDQRAIGSPHRHLGALGVEHVDRGSIGGGTDVADPAEERVALHLVAEFVFRRGDPVLDGGEGDDAGGEEYRVLLLHGDFVFVWAGPPASVVN